MVGDLGHQRQARGLCAGVYRGLVFGRVRHAAGATTNDGASVVCQIDVWQCVVIKADAVGLIHREPAFAQNGTVFIVRCFVFGTQLQDQKWFQGEDLPGELYWPR